ncbi:MAG: phosphoribosylformylglycinamidine synthase subunit PurS [Armatimonadetes bacterium]|nr:phosphoribosylformylglycinamidine synthase subunit PurS [Armatimonadota bacterium]
MEYQVKAYITLKPGILDIQGETIKGALHSLGYLEVEKVHSGKFLKLKIAADNLKTAKERAAKMGEELLANPIIEDYKFEVKEGN